MVKHRSKELLPLVVFLCLPLLVSAIYYLPTIFWHQDNPALDRRYWSKVVNVQIFQRISFLCPTNYVDIVPSTDANNKIKSYYNLYVREVPADEPNPDYTTFCDRTKSRYIFSCNRTRDTPPDFTKEGSHKSFPINTHQAHESIPTFTRGKQYIFFSTSNGQQASLDSLSTICTIVFRIYFCNTSEPCPESLCSTFGREDVCQPKLKPTPECDCSIDKQEKEVFVDPSDPKAKVTWTIPKPTCDATVRDKIIQPNVAPGDEFGLDSYDHVSYEYKFADFSITCRVDIKVKVIPCKGKDYDPKTHVCCCGVLSPKMPGGKCCGSAYYNPKKQKCCNDGFSNVAGLTGNCFGATS